MSRASAIRGARISALQQNRATFLTLLTKASSIGDILAVQQQIQDVQTQIEQLQGQQKLLADTSDLATISLKVTETGAAAPGPTSHSGFGDAFHHAGSGFARGLQALIATSGPALLVLLVLPWDRPCLEPATGCCDAGRCDPACCIRELEV